MVKSISTNRQITITIDYPGGVISVNHYRGRRTNGGDYIKPEAQAFMEELGWLIKPHHLEDWNLPLEVTCSGIFEDRRSVPDLSNLSKCILDTMEDITGINDRDMRWRDGKVIIGKKPARLILDIREGTLCQVSTPTKSISGASKSKTSNNIFKDKKRA